jgi:hypothetical protein
MLCQEKNVFLLNHNLHQDLEEAYSALLVPRSVPADRHGEYIESLVEEMGKPNVFTFFFVVSKCKGGEGNMCLAVTPDGIAALPTRNCGEIQFFHGVRLNLLKIVCGSQLRNSGPLFVAS